LLIDQPIKVVGLGRLHIVFVRIYDPIVCVVRLG
jgi:hypothetical protein